MALCVCVCVRKAEKHNVSYLLPGHPPLPLDLEARLCFYGSLWLSYENLRLSVHRFTYLPITHSYVTFKKKLFMFTKENHTIIVIFIFIICQDDLFYKNTQGKMLIYNVTTLALCLINATISLCLF